MAIVHLRNVKFEISNYIIKYKEEILADPTNIVPSVNQVIIYNNYIYYIYN